ncbi:hypothetical protein BRAO375_1270006 [Bradyrhizobium sp. ORS 375]|uniref:hypothetical protein n=1 Tax=Bradyrhizobium sp. (strain ORS 375) TaxID=566679 RepID=UPI0002408540|nr:hypothetical protein [Bradyrhizobium sp. ORS 375]CCD90929.1 hypothetical protein BRAO375_1270006 [Bradyrhizobium sp. ORS 375]
MNKEMPELLEVPPPPLFLETVGADGKMHKCIVEMGEDAPPWIDSKSDALVAAPNGASGHGTISVDELKFYEACSAVLGNEADWTNTFPEEPNRNVWWRLWFDDKPVDDGSGQLLGRMFRFHLPENIRHAHLELSNPKGPRIFARIDYALSLYVDLQQDKDGLFLCPRILTNYDLPAAFWGFRRALMHDAAEQTACKIITQLECDKKWSVDRYVAAAHSVLLFPRLADGHLQSVFSGLKSISKEVSDAGICMALLALMYPSLKIGDATGLAADAISAANENPPRYGCTMELLDRYIEALAEVLKFRKPPADEAINQMIARIRATFGRGDTSVTRGTSPYTPDERAIGQTAQKKSLI